MASELHHPDWNLKVCHRDIERTEGASVKKRETKTADARGSRNAERGFTMIELGIVVVLLMIVSAMALIQLHPAMQQQAANAAMIEVASELRQAREMAITQRRQIQVQFNAPDQMVLTRLNINPGVVGSVIFQPPMVYMLTAGRGDTPDGFGNGAAIVFGGIAGGPPTMMFQSDGTFVNTLGVAINGTVFLGNPTEPTAARAVTILGSTGRIKMYKANSTAWVQQ
jgi:type II secretory pathway pseudopilin PulG